MNIADVVLEMGFVREDGKTIIGQPGIDLKRMWTIDDLRKCNLEVKDPLHV
jgi:hypothetical protein